MVSGAPRSRGSSPTPSSSSSAAGCTATAKDGRDVGELIGRDPIGVVATTDVEQILAIDADCVVYSPVLADPKVVARILRSGKNVVSPVGWWYPQPDQVTDLEAACAEAGVTLHGTGIHPGGITERFPLMVSALSNAVTRCAPRSSPTSAPTGAPKWCAT